MPYEVLQEYPVILLDAGPFKGQATPNIPKILAGHRAARRAATRSQSSHEPQQVVADPLPARPGDL